MKYYEVLARCGHVGKNNYTPQKFYKHCESKKEAASLVRNCKRVKHDHKFAILEVKEISKQEYISGIKANCKNMYFKVHCRQDQKRWNAVSQDQIFKEAVEVTYKKTHKKQSLRFTVRVNEFRKMKQGGFMEYVE